MSVTQNQAKEEMYYRKIQVRKKTGKQTKNCIPYNAFCRYVSFLQYLVVSNVIMLL